MKKSDHEQQKIWLITGTLQGLGLATVKYLLSRGQTVIATTRDIDEFDAGLRKHPNLEMVSPDLTSEIAVQQFVELIAAKYGRIDMLINNIGYGSAGAIEEVTTDEIVKMLAINIDAPLNIHSTTNPSFGKKIKIMKIIKTGMLTVLLAVFSVSLATAQTSAANTFLDGLQFTDIMQRVKNIQ